VTLLFAVPQSPPQAKKRVPTTEPASALTRIGTLIAVVLPFLGLLAAILSLWGWAFSWRELSVFLGMYVATALGVTVGYHRFFTHRSFETGRTMQFVLGVLGSMALQGSLFQWVAYHRRHHEHSDGQEDPHSPHHHGPGLRGVLRGLWHAHIGWFFTSSSPCLSRYIPDLRKSAMLRSVSALFPLWIVVGLLVPGLAGWLLMGGWIGLVCGLLWGGLVRIFFVHHVTWSINSVCHMWGGQPFRGQDQSRNNLIFGVLAFGEGWHNNHHAFPTSARHGFRWWQLDASYWTIRAMALCGLAWNVKVPAAETLAT
jgi:stearoyl-CoA desaturase (Delta-9 desaturase)